MWKIKNYLEPEIFLLQNIFLEKRISGCLIIAYFFQPKKSNDMKKIIKLSDYIAERLRDKYGVKYIFMITGGGAMHLNDSFGKTRGLKYFCNHHEQASAIAAECYARLTNKIGVCNVTTGPGGTNTFTGLIGAWLDSIPMLIISGQIKREVSAYSYPHLKLRQIGIQEVNIVDMAKPVTKYAKAVINPYDIGYELDKAIYLARSGRPGSVWLDIPQDVQGAMIDVGSLKSFDPKEIVTKPDLKLLKKNQNIWRKLCLQLTMHLPHYFSKKNTRM